MKENTKEELLRCALQLFSENGFENTGVSELVQAAGVTKPTLYYFFENKEGIFQAILNHGYSVFFQELDKAAEYVADTPHYENDVYAALLRVTGTFYSFAKANPQFYQLILALDTAPRNSRSAQLSQPFKDQQFETISKMFFAISEAHANLKGKEIMLSTHFVAIINSDIRNWLYRFDSLDQSKAAALTHAFMHGIF